MASLRTGVVVATAVLAAANCATLSHGTSQHILVDSAPPGATVFLDGRAVAATPAAIRVSRRNPTPTFRIEKEEFRPFTKTLQRRESWLPLLGDIGLAAVIIPTVGRFLLDLAGSGDEGPVTFGQVLIAWSAGAAPLLADYANGSAFEFASGKIDARLVPDGERRLEAPARLPEDLRRSLVHAAAPTVTDQR